MKLNEVLAALPHLSQTELATIKAAIDHLLTQQVDEVDLTSPLYDAMAKALGLQLSFRDFHNIVSYKTWKRTAPVVVRFIETTYPQATKVAKLAMMSFLIEALLEDLKSRGVPLSLGQVTLNLERLPMLYDQSFPDYRKSGMTNIVLEAMTKKYQPKESE